MKLEFKTFEEEKPTHGQIIFLRQGDLLERGIYNEDGSIELILPNHKFTSIMTKPTHWSCDTY